MLFWRRYQKNLIVWISDACVSIDLSEKNRISANWPIVEVGIERRRLSDGSIRVEPYTSTAVMPRSADLEMLREPLEALAGVLDLGGYKFCVAYPEVGGFQIRAVIAGGDLDASPEEFLYPVKGPRDAILWESDLYEKGIARRRRSSGHRNFLNENC